MKKKLKKQDIERWEEAALFHENDKNFSKIIDKSEVVSAIEARKMLGPGTKKLVSMRIPEEDLLALRYLAKKYNRSYQQIAIVAIEKYLDEHYESLTKSKSK